MSQEEPKKNYWKDLWRYRELFYILSWRDLKVRYKQTTIGILWAIIRPLVTMIIFTLVFGGLAKMPSPAGVPYAVLVFAGLLPWQFFSNGLTESSTSLIGNEKLITKVYFPRLIIPASSFVTSFIDFLISFALFLAVCFFYNYKPPLQIIWMPFFWLLAFAASFGPGLYITALNVKYRDFRYIIPFIVQFGLFISPVGFSSEAIPQKWKLIYSLNPLTGVIDGFRWCLVRGTPNPLLQGNFYISLIIVVFFSLAKYLPIPKNGAKFCRFDLAWFIS